MFRRVLIANRGEIACRVIRTTRALGMDSVAVYSQADRGALHVDLADEAWEIGPGPALDSYLSIDKIVSVSRRSAVEAVHPGYGFLAESAAFSERIRDAGIAFVGPSPDAMRAVGSKAAAKRLMLRIGVPTLPGFHGDEQEFQTFADAAQHVGFPVVVKAFAGGGGRGMRVVESAEELELAIENARREAILAFGDGRLLVEKFLAHPRHIEVQILGDKYGNVIGFPARDCSMQRHHQKVLEECPASNLTSSLRDALRDAAVEIGRAVSYDGAGTVEFLVKDDAFYFLEVNARLQVEHPVTEITSGIDLVEWQFRIAAGQYLTINQQDICVNGYAIEARICAEDPAAHFMPSTGEIKHLAFPPEMNGIRVDSGIRTGDAISPFYDSLLAKLIVKGETRADAVRKMSYALERVELIGVSNNLDLLRALVASPFFISGGADTTFIDRLAKETELVEADAGWLIAAAAIIWIEVGPSATGYASSHNLSPWSLTDSWRLYGESELSFRFRYGDRTLAGSIRRVAGQGFRVRVPEGFLTVSAVAHGRHLSLNINGLQRVLTAISDGKTIYIINRGRLHRLEWEDPLQPAVTEEDKERSLAAPLPARVTRIFVKGGDRVAKGEPILMLEAMKMEIPINSHLAGVVEAILCSVGQAVQEGEQLVALAEAK